MRNNLRPYLLDLPFDELKQALLAIEEPAYRATQLWQGIYQQLWPSLEQFTSLSKALREKLVGQYDFTALKPVRSLESKDALTQKMLFYLRDGLPIETVLMRYQNRQTLCISSQSGCPMGCVFCATGQMGFRRNLTSGEIVEQVLYYARLLKAESLPVTNIVLMGMGEPFLNYDAALGAIDRLNDPTGYNFGARRFTISTVGVVPGIRRFTKENRQVNLALSLHAANDELRTSLLPINKKYPLSELMDACREYVAVTNRRITFEWALIQNVNDTTAHAQELAHLVKGLLCHVNVIPLNPTHNYAGAPTTRQRAEAFQAELERYGIPCTIRLRRGIEIEAGCGQLASEVG
ncbi:MAG: 23S rRNA (adenine(2503)-C(2))-methyltransferase RlmN [Anaerolineaceae bacterium]